VKKDTSYEWRKQLMWGLVLIAAGVAIFVDQMDWFDIRGMWHYWTLVLVVVGINKMIGFPTARDFTSGLWITFTGLWLFAVFEGLFGLTFRNSWPVFIIASGVSMIIEPLIQRRFAQNEEPGNEN
jgi:hypothetical protein